MANVDWSTGIDSVSGALSKPSKKGLHSCAKTMKSYYWKLVKAQVTRESLNG